MGVKRAFDLIVGFHPILAHNCFGFAVITFLLWFSTARLFRFSFNLIRNLLCGQSAIMHLIQDAASRRSVIMNMNASPALKCDKEWHYINTKLPIYEPLIDRIDTGAEELEKEQKNTTEAKKNDKKGDK